MSKKRSFEPRDLRSPKDASVRRPSSPQIPNPTESQKWNREAIESLIVAIVLALMIRSFEAEAFVIPTGSMAPTLQGRHKDVECSKCGYAYRTGASEDAEIRGGDVVTTVCPMCKFPMELNESGPNSAHQSFTGDRILVNKFAFDVMGKPERWDVIVFKYPGNSKQNYIKRLIGLPGETVRLDHGDVYVKPRDATDDEYRIARKPPEKLQTLLQPVHDTKFIPSDFEQVNLPAAWQPSGDGHDFTSSDYGRTFSLNATAAPQWIRYRHILPIAEEWAAMAASDPVSVSGHMGGLVTDFYAYNAAFHGGKNDSDNRLSAARFLDSYEGSNWVGDLAVDAEVTIQSPAGMLMLDLVEGGWHFRCQINIASGEARLTINDGQQVWGEGLATLQPPSESAVAVAQTGIVGTGEYRVMMANVDNEVRLWINGRACEFDRPTTYERPANIRPVWSESEPGDLAPAGIGGENLSMQVTRLQILRDIYYTAVKRDDRLAGEIPSQADFANRVNLSRSGLDRTTREELSRPELLYRNPQRWQQSPAWDMMAKVEFDLQDFDDDERDQFLPMGDNSPQSQDGRIWETDLYVERQLLIGKAVFVYWPHPWHTIVPNFRRMGRIH